MLAPIASLATSFCLKTPRTSIRKHIYNVDNEAQPQLSEHATRTSCLKITHVLKAGPRGVLRRRPNLRCMEVRMPSYILTPVPPEKVTHLNDVPAKFSSVTCSGDYILPRFSLTAAADRRTLGVSVWFAHICQPGTRFQFLQLRSVSGF